MDRDELKRRILANLPGGPRQFVVPMIFLVEAVIGGFIAWLEPKLLDKLCPARPRNPGPIAQYRMRRALRSVCQDVALERPEAAELHLDGDDLYDQIGDDVFEAFLATGREVTDDEIESYKANIARSL